MLFANNFHYHTLYCYKSSYQVKKDSYEILADQLETDGNMEEGNCPWKIKM
jgi:hypothetical protein